MGILNILNGVPNRKKSLNQLQEIEEKFFNGLIQAAGAVLPVGLNKKFVSKRKTTKDEIIGYLTARQNGIKELRQWCCTVLPLQLLVKFNSKLEALDKAYQDSVKEIEKANKGGKNPLRKCLKNLVEKVNAIVEQSQLPVLGHSQTSIPTPTELNFSSSEVTPNYRHRAQSSIDDVCEEELTGGVSSPVLVERTAELTAVATFSIASLEHTASAVLQNPIPRVQYSLSPVWEDEKKEGLPDGASSPVSSERMAEVVPTRSEIEKINSVQPPPRPASAPAKLDTEIDNRTSDRPTGAFSPVPPEHTAVAVPTRVETEINNNNVQTPKRRASAPAKVKTEINNNAQPLHPASASTVPTERTIGEVLARSAAVRNNNASPPSRPVSVPARGETEINNSVQPPHPASASPLSDKPAGASRAKRWFKIFIAVSLIAIGATLIGLGVGAVLGVAFTYAGLGVIGLGAISALFVGSQYKSPSPTPINAFQTNSSVNAISSSLSSVTGQQSLISNKAGKAPALNASCSTFGKPSGMFSATNGPANINSGEHNHSLLPASAFTPSTSIT